MIAIFILISIDSFNYFWGDLFFLGKELTLLHTQGRYNFIKATSCLALEQNFIFGEGCSQAWGFVIMGRTKGFNAVTGFFDFKQL